MTVNNTEITLFGEKLKNPVIPASGTFGFGREMAEFYDIGILGSIALKGTTLEPRYGNPLPRIAECPLGLINAIGLQNPGAKKVLEEEIPALTKVYNDKIIVNIGGHSFDEYIDAVKVFNGCDKVLAIELNISCPNVKGGGMAFGTDAKIIESLVSEVKRVTDRKLIVKLSPNVTDIGASARAAERGGANAISLINTLVGMRIDLKTKKPIISTIKGGYSGRGIYPVALRMVYEVFDAVNIPIIGMGGINSANDVLEMLLAGASAVMVGTANLIDPYACKKIIEDLPSVMAEYGIDHLEKIIGLAHN